MVMWNRDKKISNGWLLEVGPIGLTNGSVALYDEN